MAGHLFTVVALLLALASYLAGMTGVGMALFFVGAAIEIVLWLGAVQPPRRGHNRPLARLNLHR